MEVVEIVFHSIGFVVTLLNVLTFLALRRRLIRAIPRRALLATLAVGIPFWLLLYPGLTLMIGGIYGLMAVRDGVADSVGITAMAFQFAVWAYGGALLAKWAPTATVHGIRKLRRLAVSEKAGTPPARELVDEERRRLMARAALIVPAAMVATAAGGALASRVVPRVNRLRMPLAREFSQLRGLTIAQVSDVHIGSYMDWPRLSEIAEAMNAIGADYHVVTGDLIDNAMGQLEHAQRFLRALKPRRGQVFMSMGNHEYIAARDGDSRQVVDALRETGVNLLIDEAQKVELGGAHFWMGGLDYPPQAGLPRLHDRNVEEGLKRVLSEMRDDGAPRILLSHHPRTFTTIRHAPIDLTLAGHTHGGQIKLGRIGDYALTPMLPFDFYHNGLYQHEGRRLYVNAGAGGWLPIRINVPPEITLIELV